MSCFIFLKGVNKTKQNSRTNHLTYHQQVWSLLVWTQVYQLVKHWRSWGISPILHPWKTITLIISTTVFSKNLADQDICLSKRLDLSKNDFKIDRRHQLTRTNLKFTKLDFLDTKTFSRLLLTENWFVMSSLTISHQPQSQYRSPASEILQLLTGKLFHYMYHVKNAQGVSYF